MGLQGAEWSLLGYNTPTHNIDHPEPWHLRMFHNRLVMQAGAYQNTSWVVAAAKAGTEDGHGLIGGSCIIAPTGEIMAQALSEDDEVIVVDATSISAATTRPPCSRSKSTAGSSITA